MAKAPARWKGWVAVLLALGLLGGAFFGADFFAKRSAEQEIQSRVREELNAPTATATIGPGIFLWQAVQGKIDTVNLTAPEATIRSVRLVQVNATLEGVTLGNPRAENLTIHGLLSAEDLPAVLAQTQVPEGVTLSWRDGQVHAELELFGQPVDIQLNLTPTPAGVGATVEAVSLAGIPSQDPVVTAAVTAALGSFSVPLPLPTGVNLQNLTPTSAGLNVSLQGTGVSLSQL